MVRVRYGGSFDVNKPRDFVYNFLVDPRNVASAIPGVESVEVLDQDNFRVRASLGVGAIRGTVNITARFVEKRPPESAKIVGRGSGMQSNVDFEMGFNLEEVGPGAVRVNWYFDGNIGGLIGSMGARVLDPVAQRIIQETIQKLKQKLSG
ncbi:MAG: carbon monoxide dehydrogenase subunit G [Vulcanisaeta sp.]|nr:carbon monoxide dehydrogenase subunit G [Vulcanisaeta sp.]MCG2892457.1 carbon monoxide dehydrogenase subunit G [Vulcanisaeta sp.]MCG2895656.1 carbon monoxide dehydrogenase subunit G [Vulcanisaeta sp.]